MLRLTLFKGRLNLVKELKLMVGGCSKLGTHVARKTAMVGLIVSTMFLHYFVGL